ncbi:putative efflux pump periplasmic linker TtgA precursor [Allorhodopirellula heiligendammensis]|uniref:Efflux pump periplasmic linker TtgA n=2 Tax=Allorhodopirellula heiligendammensis TaxID=2714739 RepID=A0A5C6BKJ0_9BACT|nr:putative efflux pump periplasmic linker TtgA precursor [Allorhodopirellula heiligendammensis]
MHHPVAGFVLPIFSAQRVDRSRECQARPKFAGSAKDEWIRGSLTLNDILAPIRFLPCRLGRDPVSTSQVPIMKIAPFTQFVILLFILCLPACDKMEQLKDQYVGGHSTGEGEHADGEHGTGEGEHAEGGEEGEIEHKIVVTSPVLEDVVSTQEYVCQVHAWRHIEVCALEGGYLESIDVKEGQLVQKGDRMFKILPILYEAKLAADKAHAELMRIKRDNTKRLFEKNIVAKPEVDLANAELATAEAEVMLAQAEMDFADIKAPFNGIVDRQLFQPGSLIDDGDVLTTLSDNSLLWVYFNVPERNYLAYQADAEKDQLKVNLRLANGEMYPREGKIGAIEADFNNETGNISFRADFESPDRVLRHGQTGTIILSRVVDDAVVIPQRATYEILAKKYAFVVDEDNVVHQRDITIASEKDDIYLIKDGLDINDKIIFEGIRQVRDGEKIEYEYEAPEDVMKHLKYHAE